jgi:glycosyltransferase involved in cell wall biosynthesis
MAAIYRLATMLVMPSLYESVSIPIFEAFQAGTPVAASSIFAIPEQVGNAAVLFDPLSPDAIAEAVLSLANDTEKSAEFSRRGKALMRNVTLERYASQLQLALDALVPATPDVTERSPSSRATT